MDHKLCYFVWALSIPIYFSFLVNERFNTVKLEDPTKVGRNETPSAGENSNDVTVAKGQIISERNCGILNFPKKQRKNLTNFCPKAVTK